MRKRLILGCGINRHTREDGDIFVDLRKFEGVDIWHDLNEYPWPFGTDTIDAIVAVHLVEHLKDLVAFMNESHRILKPGGSIYILTPNAGVNPDLEFADPTHVRCYRPHTFANYFTREGIHAFGYTDRAWAPVVIRAIPPAHDVIEFHAYAIKE